MRTTHFCVIFSVKTDTDIFCSFVDELDCRFTFTYEMEQKQVMVKAAKNKECPPQAYIMGKRGKLKIEHCYGLLQLVLYRVLFSRGGISVNIHNCTYWSRFSHYVEDLHLGPGSSRVCQVRKRKNDGQMGRGKYL